MNQYDRIADVVERLNQAVLMLSIKYRRQRHPTMYIIDRPEPIYPIVTMAGDVIYVDDGERTHTIYPGGQFYGEWSVWIAKNRDKVYWRSVSDPNIAPQL